MQTTEFWSPIVGGMESGEPQRAGIWNQQFFEPGTYYFRSLVPPCRPPPKLAKFSSLIANRQLVCYLDLRYAGVIASDCLPRRCTNSCASPSSSSTA